MKLIVITLTSLVFSLNTHAFVQVVNDTPDTATPLVIDGGAQLSTNESAIDENSIDDVEATCWGTDGVDGDVFFSFMGNGLLVDIETFAGTNDDTQIKIVNTETGEIVGCDDDNGVNFMSLVTGVCAAEGIIYLIEVEGWNGTVGTFSIEVRTSQTQAATYCSDPIASNYNVSDVGECSVLDNSLCVYEGCTDSSACNYSGASVEDGGLFTEDGTCCFGSCVTLTLTDEYGDGWNGGFFTFTNQAGVEVLTGTAESAGQVEEPSSQVIEGLCLPAECLTLTIEGGGFPAEIGMRVETTDGFLFNYLPNELLGTGSGIILDQLLELGGEGSCDAYGCNDPLAVNYSGGTTDCSNVTNGTDFSCCAYDTPGCNDPLAVNYTGGVVDCNNEVNGVNFDCCTYESNSGCTYWFSPNYDPEAVVDDGSCLAPEESCVGDLDNSGFISVADLSIFLTVYGSLCD